MRLFVALNISPELEQALDKLGKELHSLDSLRLAKHIHLTLKYLGEVPDEKLPKVQEALSEIEFSTIKLQTTKLGTFPRVLWLGIKLNKELAQLQKHIQRAVRPWAMNDPRSYKPHLTIARFQHLTAEEGDILKNIVKEKRIEQKWKAESFVLYKSTLTPQGPLYQQMAKFGTNTFDSSRQDRDT
ncbi:RNA 2',3'-cyclic phosphodiesterase [Candidatus Woesearchaeota archaeon]|nr:RNA 2',3'-cyclic phosphodiesterase [Candidatus Woesearchaeota archaeon]